MTAHRLLSESLAGWADKYPQVRVERHLPHDVSVARTLVTASTGAAMIVVGARRLPNLSPLALGPITRALVHEAESPVAVVR
jgi:nucleotide-binding universal stress UspA family protein